MLHVLNGTIWRSFSLIATCAWQHAHIYSATCQFGYCQVLIAPQGFGFLNQLKLKWLLTQLWKRFGDGFYATDNFTRESWQLVAANLYERAKKAYCKLQNNASWISREKIKKYYALGRIFRNTKHGTPSPTYFQRRLSHLESCCGAPHCPPSWKLFVVFNLIPVPMQSWNQQGTGTYWVRKEKLFSWKRLEIIFSFLPFLWVKLFEYFSRRTLRFISGAHRTSYLEVAVVWGRHATLPPDRCVMTHDESTVANSRVKES